MDVRKFGAAGDGIRDDTHAIAAALAASPAIYVPAGTYLVQRLMVGSGRSIVTDGFATVFRQRPGMMGEIRLINVVGSHVRIDDCTVQGNIGSDRGEQRHGIFVRANKDTGNLSDVSIGNVRGSNLRGDVVYIGNDGGHVAANIRVGHVHGDNILRNVVSVVGARDVEVQGVAGTRVGYIHLDIEPDDYNGPVVGCVVGSVRGGLVQVAGSTPHAYVDGIHLGFLDLAPSRSRSIPEYPLGIERADALTIRNVRSLEIGRFIARGFEGAAVRQIWDADGIADQAVLIHAAEFSDCARSKADAYVLGSTHATRLRIDSLTIDKRRPGVEAIRNCKEVRIATFRERTSQVRVRDAPEIKPRELSYVVAGASLLLGAAMLARRFSSH